MKSQLTGRDPDAGKDRKKKKKRAAGDEMVGQHPSATREAHH